ncbi:MAG: M20/M25/M40 family metallo-hydrolase [Gemmatimonadota bacterium]
MRGNVRSGHRGPAGRKLVSILWGLLLGAGPSPLSAQAALAARDSLLARQVFKQLIEIRSESGTEAVVQAARGVAARLRDAGFPDRDVQVLAVGPRLANVIATLRGTGKSGPPILLMAHLDVVPARRADWSVDPYTFLERDGWYYGRGTTDNKAGAAMLVANLLRYRRDGLVPKRDVVVVLTGDEETGGEGIRAVMAARPDLRGAAFALNTDAGGGVLEGEREVSFGVQASEKVYLSFGLEVTNRGGHSSQPRPDNAIYQLAHGLTRLEAHRWPVVLNEVTRSFFQRYAALESGRVAADMRAVARIPPDPDAAERLSRSPYYNALMRTTCVATRLEAGHADNALPQTARATVNCRILPNQPPDEVERTLAEVLAEPAIRLTRINQPVASPPSPLTEEVLGPIERLASRMWPGVPVIPTMSTGATDGLVVRNAGVPVYGVSAIFADPSDERAHGRDERIAVRRFYDALEYWYRLVRDLAGG